MGKIALANYRAKKAKRARDGYPRQSPGGLGPINILPPTHEHRTHNGRVQTRVIAALIHDVPIATIARDLRIPRRAVAVISRRERYL